MAQVPSHSRWQGAFSHTRSTGDARRLQCHYTLGLEADVADMADLAGQVGLDSQGAPLVPSLLVCMELAACTGVRAQRDPDPRACFKALVARPCARGLRACASLGKAS